MIRPSRTWSAVWGRVFLSVTLLVMTGCGTDEPDDREGQPLDRLQSPEKLTLFSIDGRDPEKRSSAGSSGTFHGYPVLGKLEVTETGQRRHLIARLKNAYARRPESGAKCFWPRHGLRVVEGGMTVEYVICFECYWFDEYQNGTKVRRAKVNSDVQSDFDKPLRDAGIPLAPRK